MNLLYQASHDLVIHQDSSLTHQHRECCTWSTAHRRRANNRLHAQQSAQAVELIILAQQHWMNSQRPQCKTVSCMTSAVTGITNCHRQCQHTSEKCLENVRPKFIWENPDQTQPSRGKFTFQKRQSDLRHIS